MSDNGKEESIKAIKDRWVYSLSPREVKGDEDALVCVVDTSKHYSRDCIACCQVKNLQKMFEYGRYREDFLDRGGDKRSLNHCPNFVDDSDYMVTIAKVKPEMWKQMYRQKSSYECVLPEGVTKENFADCCTAYNKYKGLSCEFDGDMLSKTESQQSTHVKYKMTLLHKLYCEFKDKACGSGNCFSKNEYYTNRCIPALCFVRWLVKTDEASLLNEDIQKEVMHDESEESQVSS